MSVATLPPRSSQSSEQPPEEVWPKWLVPPEEGYFAEDLDRLKYAEAGIRYYWRIRRDFEERSLPVVHLYELDESGRYEEIDVQSGRISAGIPFPLSIDLTDLG